MTCDEGTVGLLDQSSVDILLTKFSRASMPEMVRVLFIYMSSVPNGPCSIKRDIGHLCHDELKPKSQPPEGSPQTNHNNQQQHDDPMLPEPTNSVPQSSPYPPVPYLSALLT